VDANIGDNIIFTCLTAWTSTRKFPQWLFNYRRKLPENTLKKGKTLIIQNIRHNNSGLYNCFGMKPGIHEHFFVATATIKVLGKFMIVL